MESKKRKKVDDGMAMELVDVDGVACDGGRAIADVMEPEVPRGKHEDLYIVHEKQFRSIFPPETWERILSKLDPEDQENCANASPYFWELLQKQRTLFLLPKVFDIMALIFEQDYYVSMHEWDGYDATSGEPVAKAGTMNHSLNSEEWKETVLKCRLVCSTWNKAIENCYQKPLMTGIPEFADEIDPRSKLVNLGNIHWTKLRDISRQLDLRPFRDHFDAIHLSGVGTPPKNPILGRYLVIRIDSWSSNYVNDVLKKFGKEIWYLKANILGGRPQDPARIHLNVFRKLRSFLRLVPNLKFLNISSAYPIPHLSSQSGKHPDVIVCSPLPKFEKLEILCLKNLGSQIGSELIRKNAHVTYLKIRKMDFDVNVENSLEMPNLQGFSVTDSRSGEKMLENLGPNWNKVKKLCFGAGYERYSGNSVQPIVGIGAPEAFAIFQNNWTETLTDLHLQFPFGFDEKTVLEQSKALRLNLHGVRRLTLRDFPVFFLDFVLPLKNSLEHLVFKLETLNSPFRNEYRKRVQKEQTIKFAGFEDRMQRSNIWKFFGKLETIKMEKLWDLGNKFTLFTKEKDKLYYCRKKELFVQRGI